MFNRTIREADLLFQIKLLKDKVAAFESGEKFLRMREEYRANLKSCERQIKKLRIELAEAHAQTIDVRNKWYDTCDDTMKEADAVKQRCETRIRQMQERIFEIQRTGDERIDRIKNEYEEKLSEKEAVIKELINKLAHAQALLERDGSNTGLPTSQTPVGKKKVIPNSRRGTGKRKGGQPGHTRHVLEPPAEDEITDTVTHEAGEDDACSRCGSHSYVFTGDTEKKYEYEVEINVVKRAHVYYVYRCRNCGELFRLMTAPGSNGECRYGSGIQSLALSLMNTVNVPINKVRMLFDGITGGQILPCEGYIAKLQKKAAAALVMFMEELRHVLITRVLVYWDDTVIMIHTARACLRFYGDESIAFYTAHMHKDMDSLDDDRVLDLLTGDTTVMHDHNKVNYNEKYSFENIECNQHLQRDLKKSADDTQHTELLELKELISEMIMKRKRLIEKGGGSFSCYQLREFRRKTDDILDRAQKHSKEDDNPYFGQFEKTLIERIRKYRDCYFRWMTDFSLPTTNNLSERALRCVKSHMKISGQFESEQTAGYYATIKSYIETCRRNGINEIRALTRLCEGRPYSVQEILSYSSA